MAHSPILPPNRHVPYKKGGWGAALLTIAAVAALYLTAFIIHERTYRHPRDLMMHETYEEPGNPHQTAQGTPNAAPPATTPAR
jgi:hypothetical protein